MSTYADLTAEHARAVAAWRDAYWRAWDRRLTATRDERRELKRAEREAHAEKERLGRLLLALPSEPNPIHPLNPRLAA